MKVSKIAIVALIAMAIDNQGVNAIRSSVTDFNGADEDEIMDKVFSKYS